MIWLVAPILQINLGLDEKARGWSFNEGVRVTSLTGVIRRLLLDSAKAANCNDYILHELNSASALIWIAMPEPGLFPMDKNVLNAAVFRGIADEITNRVLDCLRLLDSITLLGRRAQHCWFVTSEDINVDDKSRFQPPDANFRSGPGIFLFDEELHFHVVHPSWIPMEPDYLDPGWNGDAELHEGAGTSALMFLGTFQDRLLSICGFKDLRAIFTDHEKQKKYSAQGREQVKKKRLEFREEYTDPERMDDERQETHAFQVKSKSEVNWYIDGMFSAFTTEIKNLNRILYGGGSAALFPRAFGIFSTAVKLERPSRFVLICTCLEALLSGTGTTDLTYKLASRIAWLLEPTDGRTRVETFKNVTELYAYRSKIVHGSSFRIEQYEPKEEEMLAITRDVFRAVLRSDAAWNSLSGDNESHANEYLKALSLGAI